MKRLALAIIVHAAMATTTSGCDRQAAPAEGGAGAGGLAASRAPGAVPAAPMDGPPLSPGDRQRLKDELRAELEAELREALTRELRPKIRAELERELAERNGGGPTRVASADKDAGGAGEPRTTPMGGPPPEPDGGAPRDGDPWNTPGAKVWPASPGGFRLIEVEVGTGLEEKMPTDVRSDYASVPELLYCYTVFENPGSEVTVTHVWRRGTRLVSRVELEVGSSPKWKTWSKQRTQTNWTGLWSCEVLGPEGEQLGLTVFRIGTGMP